MMKSLQGIDSKTITSAGGIVIALLLGYGMIKMSTNDVAHLEASVIQHSADMSSIQMETNEVLRRNTVVIEGNTKVLEILLQTWPNR